MDFVSDEQRKAIMASYRNRGMLRPRSDSSYFWPLNVDKREQDHLVKEINQVLVVQIPKESKAKKSLSLKLTDIIIMAERAKIDGNTILQLREKKQQLENTILGHNTIFKDKTKLEQKQEKKRQNVNLPKFKKVKCLYCNMLFISEFGCDCHINEVHLNLKHKQENKGQNAKLPNSKKVKCLYCSKLFKIEYDRDCHTKKMHPNEEMANKYPETTEKAETANEYPENLTCEYCGTKCASRIALEEHVTSWKHRLMSL
ncbi:MAG TPA: hypothetical protein VFD03_04050 [Clostridia bacterium]|nr:hypothetical protein [Clostridia bacterium]